MWGLRAPPRCTTAPLGANGASTGSRLKLNVVRRNRAGQISNVCHSRLHEMVVACGWTWLEVDLNRWLTTTVRGAADSEHSPATLDL